MTLCTHSHYPSPFRFIPFSMKSTCLFKLTMKQKTECTTGLSEGKNNHVEILHRPMLARLIWSLYIENKRMTNETSQSKHSCKYHHLEDRTSTSNWPVSKSEWQRNIKGLSHCWDKSFKSFQNTEIWSHWKEWTSHWEGEWMKHNQWQTERKTGQRVASSTLRLNEHGRPRNIA